jgi:hypothetical protein
MKSFLLSLILFSSSYVQAETNTSKFCENFYKSAFKRKNYKLHAVYESKTLCAFEMDKNTISFNENSVAPGQKLTAKEKEEINYKGKWINIFSKDQSKDVINYNLFDIEVANKDSCLSALPIKNYIQCPLSDENMFKVIINLKNENFIKKEFKPYLSS